jgi:hypothetical protein
MTRDEVRAAGPNVEAESEVTPAQSECAEVDVLPMIQQAVERHRADLPELMKQHAYRWAAYRGAERLEIGKSKRKLYHKYLDRGLSLDELVVLGIGPEIPDVIDAQEPPDA